MILVCTAMIAFARWQSVIGAYRVLPFEAAVEGGLFWREIGKRTAIEVGQD